MAITVTTRTSQLPVSKALVTLAVTKALDHIGSPDADISVQLCGDAAVKKLNATYRRKDVTTDVLSFPTDQISLEDPADMGDLVLSIPQIIRQAKAHHIDSKEECVRMLVHGTLHLAGYNHESLKDKKSMFSIQEKLVLDICV